jgi:hypothetical protein
MDFVAQLVRALVCGAEGRGFEPHRGPLKKLNKLPFLGGFLIYTQCFYIKHQINDDDKS